jgi:hypothetical protein
VDDEEVAIPVGGAAISILVLDGAARREGEGHVIAVRGVEIVGRGEGLEGGVGVGGEDLDGELDAQAGGAPAAVVGEPAGDGLGAVAPGERGDILGPGLRLGEKADAAWDEAPAASATGLTSEPPSPVDPEVPAQAVRAAGRVSAAAARSREGLFQASL